MSSLPVVFNREQILYLSSREDFVALADAPAQLKCDRDFMMAAASRRGA